jgi:hypothetical protein
VGDDSGAILEALRRIAASQPLDVFEGALLVALLIDPAADLVGARARVEELARRVEERRAAGLPKLEALRGVLFAEEGLTGDF